MVRNKREDINLQILFQSLSSCSTEVTSRQYVGKNCKCTSRYFLLLMYSFVPNNTFLINQSGRSEHNREVTCYVSKVTFGFWISTCPCMELFWEQLNLFFKFHITQILLVEWHVNLKHLCLTSTQRANLMYGISLSFSHMVFILHIYIRKQRFC